MDAIRYGYISHTVLQSGDWFNLVDGLTGQPYVNKPPLLFWLTALSFKVFGYSTFSAKLPGALSSFIALILLFKLAVRRSDVRTALFAVALFALTRNFMRSMVDLSFEGIAACGALSCLLGLDRWIVNEKPDFKSSLIIAIGLLLLLMSKPPYLILVAPAIAWVSLVAKARLKDILIFTAVVVFGSSWWWFMPQELLFAAYDNQVALPIREAASPLKNFGMWFVSLFKNYPLLALFGVIGLLRGFRTHRFNNLGEQVLLVWILPILAVFLIIDVRPRYILVPVLGLTVIAALEARTLFSKASERLLANILVVIALGLTIFSFSGTEVHRADPILARARASTEDSFCVQRKEQHKEAGQNRMSEMLIELETGRKVRVYSPKDGEQCS